MLLGVSGVREVNKIWAAFPRTAIKCHVMFLDGRRALVGCVTSWFRSFPSAPCFHISRRKSLAAGNSGLRLSHTPLTPPGSEPKQLTTFSVVPDTKMRACMPVTGASDLKATPPSSPNK